MSSSEWADAGLQAFDAVVQASAGFRGRPGQRRMAAQVAGTLAAATLGKTGEGEDDDGAAPARAIAVVQAGTGVGKSLAYCAPAIAIALARNTRVLISTATVALQEQLVHKDLPALAAALPQPFKFALAKGRGRYVCQLKLERLSSIAAPGAEDGDTDEDDDLFAEEEAAARAARAARPAHEVEARIRFYAGVAQALARGAWDGDRDTLDTPPAAEVWAPMAADASSCTGRHCPSFQQCAYYERRKVLVGAQVIVVNHDLLLASLGNRLLPDLDNCLLVLDEAHHLPATALAQFACRMDLGRHTWAERLAQRALRTGMRLEVPEAPDIPTHAARMRAAMQTIERIALDLFGPALTAASGKGPGPARLRLPRGELPQALEAPLAEIAHHASGFLEALRAIAKALRAEMRDHPENARRLSTLYAQIGALAPRLDEVFETAQLLLREAPAGGVPAAKWFTLELPPPDIPGAAATLQVHASPLLPGSTLRHHLWRQARGAVLTSATLTSCGQFDFFLREAGLQGDDAVTTLEVPSPFDYPAQGRLVTAVTRADPRDAAGYTAEMVQALLRDIATVRHGALVLFTSRDQLRQAVNALPEALRPRVLVQTALPRMQLLATHRERIAAGRPSVIFGMQSFGEGLDLPGTLCEAVFIAKLPFAPPDDPVGEARAEWLRGVGRDPFVELVVPATAIRLAQWVGRAIRTEEDQASVYCYDRRLVQTAYGQRLLQGLPAFARIEVAAGAGAVPAV